MSCIFIFNLLGFFYSLSLSLSLSSTEHFFGGFSWCVFSLFLVHCAFFACVYIRRCRLFQLRAGWCRRFSAFVSLELLVECWPTYPSGEFRSWFSRQWGGVANAERCMRPWGKNDRRDYSKFTMFVVCAPPKAWSGEIRFGNSSQGVCYLITRVIG